MKMLFEFHDMYRLIVIGYPNVRKRQTGLADQPEFNGSCLTLKNIKTIK